MAAAAAGSRSGTDVTIIRPEAFSRFGSSFWASGGAGVAGLGMPGAPFANPAALNYTSLEVYLEAAQRFNTTWLAGIDYDGQMIAPSFAITAPKGPPPRCTFSIASSMARRISALLSAMLFSSSLYSNPLHS